MRLDLYLATTNGISRSRAANLIELGAVRVNGKTVDKASYDVKDGDEVVVNEDYGSSLGGIKLKHALSYFSVNPEGKTCMDVGASNGGFSDVLLKNGAKTVYAIDVGECALPDTIKFDARVVVMDKTNARYITRDNFSETPNFAVVDVSFISLTLILPAVYSVLSDDGELVALIKPQFECEKKDLSKKGILLDKKKRLFVVRKIEDFCKELGFDVKGTTESPHPFADKNVEYLIYCKKGRE